MRTEGFTLHVPDRTDLADVLALHAEHDPGTPVVARMRPGNRASLSTAAAAGLRHIGDDSDGSPVLADRDVAPAVLAALPRTPRPGSCTPDATHGGRIGADSRD